MRKILSTQGHQTEIRPIIIIIVQLPYAISSNQELIYNCSYYHDNKLVKDSFFIDYVLEVADSNHL